MKKNIPPHAEMRSRWRIIKGLLKAHYEAERRFAEATDRRSRLIADGMKGALDRVLEDVSSGESIAKLMADMEAVFGIPCPVDARHRTALRPFGADELRVMRDAIYADVIALLDQLQGAA